MRLKQSPTTRSAGLFGSRLEQIINKKHEPVRLAGTIDWAWLDDKIAPLSGDIRLSRWLLNGRLCDPPEPCRPLLKLVSHSRWVSKDRTSETAE